MLVSLALFAGSTVLGALRFYLMAAPQPIQAEIQAPDASLTTQASGYKVVLQREPDNQAALEGLVNTRLQMQDSEGAIDLLEKLVKLNPNRLDYTALLNKVRQETNSSN